MILKGEMDNYTKLFIYQNWAVIDQICTTMTFYTKTLPPVGGGDGTWKQNDNMHYAPRKHSKRFSSTG